MESRYLDGLLGEVATKANSKQGAKKLALVFPISTLDFLVDVFLNLALENSSPGRLVKARSLEDMCRINPVILPPPHNMFLQVLAKLELVYRYLGRSQSIRNGRMGLRGCLDRRTWRSDKEWR